MNNKSVSNDNLFAEFDKELDTADAIRYAEEHFQDFISVRDNAYKTVYTTYGNWLGIASPSLVDYRVIGGHKRGRLLKKPVKEGDRYNKIVYGEDGRPVSVTHVNEFGTQNTYFFFDFGNFTWAIELNESDNPNYNGKHLYGNIFKYSYDSFGHITYLAEISPGSIRLERYEYLDDASIVCHMYYYVPNLSGSHKSIPAGFKGSPMSEYRYEISQEQDIKEYAKKENGYSFIREIKKAATQKSSAPKPAADSYERFASWLDCELANEKVPTNGGIFFLLFGPNEDGFGISFNVCISFDKEDDDWASESYYSSSMHMIQTTGECEYDNALKHAAALVRKYIRSGKERHILKKYAGIGIGFSDGDIVYP